MLRHPLVRVAITIAAALLFALGAAAVLAPRLVAARLHARAAGAGLDATWRTLDVQLFPPSARLAGLIVRSRADGDTVVAATTSAVSLRTGALLRGQLLPATLTLSQASIRMSGGRGADADTLEPAEGDARADAGVAASVRHRADMLVRALLVPARSLPQLRLRDVTISRGGESRIALTALDLDHEAQADNFAATGVMRGETDVPFDLLLRWQRDDRLTGRAEFRIAGSEPPSPEAVVVTFDGRVTQDRRARELRIAEGSKLQLGELAARVQGFVRANGPRFSLTIEADGLDERRCIRSLPAPVLGALAGLEVTGTWDWHAGFDVDLAQPDSVRYHADVIPHGVRLDPAISRPSLHALAGPFTAQIHLPHDKIVTRELSDVNPHYRPLAAISPYLRDAVVTNEDGGFFHHRGFNTEAIGLAVAANLRAGSYKRGAGTITMQLARNLWLGHRRTLSRKGQEVVFAWLLEHMTGLPKERLLEIYFNIIEWGPEVHGADEAARYYFGCDASSLSLDQALFLAIIVPSPSKWRWRLDSDGQLRPFARAQMYFIANKMASKGWLDPAAVPPADSLRIELRGPARDLFAAPDSARATPADSLDGFPN